MERKFGRTTRDIRVSGIAWTFPKGSLVELCKCGDNTGPTWRLDTRGVTSALALHDLKYRTPTAPKDAVEEI